MRLRSVLLRRTAALMLAVLLLTVTACRDGGEPEQSANSDDRSTSVVVDVPVPAPPPEAAPVAEPGIRVPAVGDAFAPAIAAPMLSSPAGPGEGAAAMFYAAPGGTYTVKETRGGWVAAETDDGTAWTPAWYLAPEAAEAVRTAPNRVTLGANAKLSVYPGGEAAYGLRELAGQGYSDKAAAFLQWERWYGIVLPFDMWLAEGTVRRPLLLWVEASSIERVEPAGGGLMAPASGFSIVEALQLSEAMLAPGLSEAELLRVLGEPDGKESSLPLNQTGEPLRVGTDWRYGKEGGLLVATVDDNGRLAAWRWRLPYGMADEETLDSFSYPYHIVYERSAYGSVPSLEPDWQWRTKVDLAYAYLIGMDEDVMLVRGDDGGYSGMHEDSSIYALDRTDGRTLWQIDAGFGWAHAIVEPSGGEATILTRYDPAAGAYIERLRRIRLIDGETIWEHELQEHGRLAQAGGVVVHATEPFEDTPGKLVARDAERGNPLWQLEMASPYALVNRGAEDRYLLVRDDRELRALDPRTGKVVWRVSSFPLGDRNQPYETAFADASGGRIAGKYRWIQAGADRLLLDPDSGKEKARYPIRGGEFVTAVDDGMLLIQRSLDDERYWEAEKFEMILYDPIAEREIWKLQPGKPSAPVPAEETLYVLLNGKPTAVSERDGTIVWQAETAEWPNGGPPAVVIRPTIVEDTLLLPFGRDLLAIGAKDGKLLFRLKDVIVGFPDGRDNEMADGLLRTDGGETIYLGSANGYYSKLRLP